jgi:DNA invertase Pin-like site-specific DNA recombinase
MKFGYARVSKELQSLDIQIQKLEEVGCDEIFSEKVSGAKDDRKQLKELLSRLRSGDIVCVVRLDRLGRRMIKLVSLIEDLHNKGVQFISLENNIDTTTPMGMLLFNICAAFSEMERDLIKERVSAGVVAARSQGRKGGRPKSLDKKGIDKLMRLKKSNELSVKQVCEIMDISKSVYYREINKLNFNS